jgi:hypothetical protein
VRLGVLELVLDARRDEQRVAVGPTMLSFVATMVTIIWPSPRG